MANNRITRPVSGLALATGEEIVNALLEPEERRWAALRMERLVELFLKANSDSFADYCFQAAQAAFERERSFNSSADAAYEAGRDE